MLYPKTFTASLISVMINLKAILAKGKLNFVTETKLK
jgi:hypothetical protein